ncbi:purple acid phosphatase 17-like [Daucus carota subsp. sativus]|uniref:purple acid phosphatase 17-like n=1 Tax=Daucus carota subsp. sativus TaxID=79200 RepID=UPI0007EF0C9A|nr:PREDICTED: purple acid phosphatase 17-like [Daucus carota subsp. sativus]
MDCFETRIRRMLLPLMFVTLCLNVMPINAELKKIKHPVKDDGSLSFLAVGDWGRKGWYNQSIVASEMGDAGEKLNVDFVISTGDNFYDDGLTDIHDPLFLESFQKVYDANSLQKPWYTVLGNHDYRGNAEAQLSLALREIDSRWICHRSFVVESEVADFFMIDTTPFVRHYFEDPKDHVYDWRGITPRNAYLVHLLKDLEAALSMSTGKWKFVVGHHGIRSTGHHGDTEELVTDLLPLLEAYKVDFYLNGHDHCLEHVECSNSPIQFFTTGAGSKAWMTDYQKHYQCDVNFFHRGQGFLSVEVTSSTAKFVFYDVFGEVQHQWSASKELHSSM